MTGPDAPHYDPIKAAWNTVARYHTYDDAQEAVNRLADDGFPVEHLDIVGSDLRLVERVTGRMTGTRAAGSGALNGLGLGLFIGLLFGLFSPGFAWLGLALAGAAIGAVWGAGFGYAAHASNQGKRGFSSARGLVAERYDIIARGGHTDHARSMLERAGLPPTP